MKTWLLEIFTWWQGQTIGTRFHTWRFGKSVGADENGNLYYRNADDSRRWVIYNGPADASAIPPGWRGWMQRRVDTAPSEESYQPRAWQKPHLPNQTGTASAYRPKGSLLSGSERPRVSGDYDAWQP